MAGHGGTPRPARRVGRVKEVIGMKKIKVRKLDKLEATYHPYEPPGI